MTSFPSINHFRLIGQARKEPRPTRRDPPAAKAKVVDPGSPREQRYTIWLYDDQVVAGAFIVEGSLVYIEGKLVLEEWQHPQTGDHLATMRVNARFVNEPPEERTLNNLCIIARLKYEPTVKQVQGRTIAELVLEGDGNLYTVYAYDDQAQAAAHLAPGDQVFVEGVASLHDNPSGVGMRYRLRVDAYRVEDPANSQHAAEAIRAVKRRSWGDEMRTESLL